VQGPTLTGQVLANVATPSRTEQAMVHGHQVRHHR
jgi:hypothetical protein